MRIALLYGGRSGEHEVSLASAASVVRNADQKHKLVLIGITKDGVWKLQPDSVRDDALLGSGPLALRTDCPDVLVAPGAGLRAVSAHGASTVHADVVFPVLHGTFGEDGTVQGLLECAGLPYVGASVTGSALGMDKDLAKELWRHAGLPVLPSVTLRPADRQRLSEILEECRQSLGWPVFVKPCRTGSSVGASAVRDSSAFAAAVEDAFRYDSKVLIEPLVQAREIECSVIGNDKPRAFEPGEVAPTHDFYDYDAKYIDPDGAALIIPADIPEDARNRVRDLAVRAYIALGLEGLSRVDFFVDKASGEVYINEVNTLPGFTSISMYPKMCEAGGLVYKDLIEELVRLAIERHSLRQALRFTRS